MTIQEVEQWKNPVLEKSAEARGCYVSIWTGYRWEFFSGPFESAKEANWSISYWMERFDFTNDNMFRFELLDGQK